MTAENPNPGAGVSAASAPGWYGKLSTLGDFAGRRLPADVQHQLDAWLSGVVAGSREQLGEQWLERYLAAPLQRFVLGPEVLDAQWWFGVLMPSCDNVGRYFPLVVLQPRAAPPMDSAALEHLDQWWQGACQAALETLADEVDVERFDRALAGLPAWPAMVAPVMFALRPQAAGEGTAQLVLPPGCTSAELARGVAAGDWTMRLRGRSLWWSWRPQGGTSACRELQGVPSAEAFAAFLAEHGLR